LAKRERSGGVLSCFDKDLSLRRHLFDDAVVICDLQAPAPVEVDSDDAGALRVGAATFNVASILDWLGRLPGKHAHTYYVHHHDNIVVEVALFDPYERAAFLRCLHLFRTNPAAEGGSNLLGVVDRGQVWIVVLNNDNQGRFRFEFLGPTDVCNSLRSHLQLHRPLHRPDR
jgi:hypothetical protein